MVFDGHTRSLRAFLQEMTMHRPMDRRTTLKAAGITLALPSLELMTPTFASEAEPAPRRLVFICTALGLYPPNLWPKTAGADYESTPYLSLLQEHRQDFTLLSGLQHDDQVGRQPHDSEMTWLTAARKPGMGGFRNSISVDQFAANRIGNATRFPSVTLGTLTQQSQSYTSGGVMIPAQTSPADLFTTLFINGSPQSVLAQKARLAEGKSILDELGAQAAELRRRAGSADNHLLEDYYESVRRAERRIGDQEGWLDRPKPAVDAPAPQDILDDTDLIGRLQLLIDLVPLILQTDSSRVISLMIQICAVVPKVPGVSGSHHNLSHHGQDPAKIAQLQKIETRIVECFSSLLTQLKRRSESDRRLLDHTTVLFGSNLGNANAHHTRNLPVFVAGGDRTHAGYLPQPDGTPLCNLFVSMLRSAGIETSSFGQSTGTLSFLNQ